MSSEAPSSIRLAIIGGTGKEGSGLALRWARAGYAVIIGSRTHEKAERVAAELNHNPGAGTIQGLENEQAAERADIIIVTVPYSAHQATLGGIRAAVQGKIVVDVTVPIAPPRITEAVLPKGRTAAEEAQAFFGAGVHVISAFQNVSAVHLKDPDADVHCDVLVAGDDADAKAQVIALAQSAGMRGVDAGPLANAIVAESLTPVLLGINKRYGVKGAGIIITGLNINENDA